MYFTNDHVLVERMREIVDEALEEAGPSWTSALVAQGVVTRLREMDPELLNKWLDLQAEQVVRTMINDILRQRRSQARVESEQRKATSVFNDATRRFEAGDKTALGAWLNSVYVVDTDNTRKRLGEMEREELLFVASYYTERARFSAMQAAFLKAIAEKVGAGTVSDRFTDEDLSRLWRSLT